MKKPIIILSAVLTLMLSGCGTKETTTTATTQATTITTTTEMTTTEATTEAKFEYESDQFIADMINGEAPSFLGVERCDIMEDDDGFMITVSIGNSMSFPTACSVIAANFQEADYYKGSYLMIRWSSGDKWLVWDCLPDENYEKGILTSNSTDPIVNVTPQDIQDAFNQNLEGGD